MQKNRLYKHTYNGIFKENTMTTKIAAITSFFLLSSISNVQAWEACPPIIQVKSENSNQPTSITFKVDPSTPYPLDIMWIDFDGKMIKYNTLSPGQSYTQQTFVGHTWVALDGNNCSYIEATNKPTVANIATDENDDYLINEDDVSPRRSSKFFQQPAKNTPFSEGEQFWGTEIYSDVRGWRITHGSPGCSAYKPDTGPSVIFNLPNAGDWQLIYRYFDSPGDISGVVDIDRASFRDTFFTDGEWAYGSLPLHLRLAIKKGNAMHTMIGSTQYEESLDGSTAALLKLQECWKVKSGWTKASNKARRFAFSGN